MAFWNSGKNLLNRRFSAAISTANKALKAGNHSFSLPQASALLSKDVYTPTHIRPLKQTPTQRVFRSITAKPSPRVIASETAWLDRLPKAPTHAIDTSYDRMAALRMPGQPKPWNPNWSLAQKTQQIEALKFLKKAPATPTHAVRISKPSMEKLPGSVLKTKSSAYVKPPVARSVGKPSVLEAKNVQRAKPSTISLKQRVVLAKPEITALNKRCLEVLSNIRENTGLDSQEKLRRLLAVEKIRKIGTQRALARAGQSH